MVNIMRQFLLAFSTYIFPIFATPLLTWLWWKVAGGQWSLVALVMLVPLLFGYFTAFVATGVVKRWRMTTGPRIGGAYVHHGFIYASKMAFVLLLITRDPMAIRIWFDWLAVALLAGSATAFGGWWHDLHAIRAGKIELTGLVASVAERALSTFAPPTYFAVGATYGVATIVGWQMVVEQPGLFPWVFAGAFAALAIVPSIVYFAVARPNRIAR